MDKVTLAEGEGSSTTTELSVTVTDAGGLEPISLREGEEVRQTIGAREIALQIAYLPGAGDLKPGDVVVPYGGGGHVLQTLALGTGAVSITNQRVLGLIWEGLVDVESLSASVDGENGTGEVAVFAVDNDSFGRAEFKRGFTGGLKYAQLLGDAQLRLEGSFAVLNGQGEYLPAPKNAVETALQYCAD